MEILVFAMKMVTSKQTYITPMAKIILVELRFIGTKLKIQAKLFHLSKIEPIFITIIKS